MNIHLHVLCLIKGLTSCLSNVFSCAVLMENKLPLALHKVPYQCPLKLPLIHNTTLDQLGPKNPRKDVVAFQTLDSCNMKQITSHTLTSKYVTWSVTWDWHTAARQLHQALKSLISSCKGTEA